MEIENYLIKYFPKLKEDLVKARMNYSSQKFLQRVIMMSFVTFLLFIIFDQLKLPLIGLFFLSIIFLIFPFWFFMQMPKVYSKRLEIEIDKNLLYAGRYLLLKLESGEPLFNVMSSASNSYGTTGKIFAEITTDINLGTPAEDALDKAVTYCPSANLARILFEISSSLKVGTDISKPLRSIIDQISKEQAQKIEKFGKTLNSFTVFYLVLGIVVPSLGLTLFTVVASFIQLELSRLILTIILGALIFVQYMFMSIFKSMRPVVEL